MSGEKNVGTDFTCGPAPLGGIISALRASVLSRNSPNIYAARMVDLKGLIDIVFLFLFCPVWALRLKFGVFAHICRRAGCSMCLCSDHSAPCNQCCSYKCIECIECMYVLPVLYGGVVSDCSHFFLQVGVYVYWPIHQTLYTPAGHAALFLQCFGSCFFLLLLFFFSCTLRKNSRFWSTRLYKLRALAIGGLRRVWMGRGVFCRLFFTILLV